MKLNLYQNLDEVKMGEKITRKLLAYEQGESSYTLNLLYAEKGAQAPLHAHPHRQLVYIMEGRGLFQCGEERQEVQKGDVIQVDGNVPHTFLDYQEDMVWLEFFTPVREDYIPK